jgi:pimeloyl-ACP methyl ester carboxylesterase
MNTLLHRRISLVVVCRAIALLTPAAPVCGQDAPPGAPGPQGIEAQADAVAARIAALLPAPALDEPQGALPRASDSLRETYLALAAVQVEKSRDYAKQLPPDSAMSRECLRLAAALLAIGAPTGMPDCVRHGEIVEHAYFARNDGSPQPYFVYQPPACPAGRPAPLVIFLHGWVPDTCRIRPWLVPDFVLPLARKHGFLLVIPHGRTNTDFQYAGEVDVLRVLAEMRKFYAIDPDRIYLLGTSMGGAGAWQIGCHYPDLFAGIAPINGQGDWFRFWHERYDYPARAQLPRNVQWLIGLNNPMDLAQSLARLYSYSQHATKCFVGIAHTRDMVERLRAAGAPHEFFEDPDDLGHFIYWREPCWERACEHLMRQRRSGNTGDVSHTTYSLRYPGTGGVRIQRLLKWGSPASVKMRREDDLIEIGTENVASLGLDPAVLQPGTAGVCRVRWNGSDIALQRAAQSELNAPGYTPAVTGALAKSQVVCGPASDVLNFPFVAVRGTAGTAEETKVLAALAQQFCRDWDQYAEGRVRLLCDTEVTDQIMHARSLVLFGLPQNNTVVKRIAGALPFQLSRERIVLPDGRIFSTGSVGLALTYPNPLAPDRYVLIFSGVPWGSGRPRNHKFDLLPDFAVYTTEIEQPIGINRCLAAGLFDQNWKYSPDLTDFSASPPSPGAQAP